GIGLFKRDARFEPGNRGEHETAERSLAAVEGHWHQNLSLVRFRKTKLFRQNAYNFVHLSIKPETPTDNRRIAAKVALPEAVRHDRGLGYVGQAIPPIKQTAINRLDPQNGKGAVGYLESGNTFRLCSAGHAVGACGDHADVFERSALLAVDEIQVWR